MKFRITIILLLSAFVTFALQSQVKAVLEWQPIGPDGGDQFDIIISPVDPSTLFALANSAIHRSTNAGNDWEAIHTEEMSQFSILSLVFDPLDPNHIFIANGIKGIWESFDLGDNWTSFNEGLPFFNNSQVIFYPVVSLAFDVNHRLYAGIGAISEEQEFPPSWVYSYDNAGRTWTPDGTGIQITATGLTQKISTLLTIDRTYQLWAMTYGAGIYIYENGAWSPINGDLPPEALKATYFLPDPSDSNHLFLGTEQNWIFETTNGGQNWSATSLPDELAELDILPLLYTIAIDPNNSHLIRAAAWDYSGGTELPLFEPGPEQESGKGVYTSFNGGVEWSKTLEFFFRAAIDPGETITSEISPYGDVTRSRTWYKTGGGVHSLQKSVDGGVSYQTITNGIYSEWVNKIWHYSKHGQIDSMLFVAAEDGLSLRVDGTSTWARQRPVNNYLYTWSLAEDYSDNNYIFYGTGNPAWSFSEQRGVYRINYSSCFGEGCPPGDQLLGNVGVWGIITTPAQPDKIYTATQENGIMVSSDHGVSWDYFNDGLILPMSITDILLDQDGNPKLASARTNNGNPNASPPQDYNPSSSEEGSVYFYNSETLQWEPTSDINAATLDIELDPHDQQTIYAATVQGIYKSTDGINWEVVLPDKLVLDIAIDPIKPGYLYAATHYTVMRSTDGGIQWHELSNGLLKEWVFSLDFDAETGFLYAGTAGNSVYRFLPDPNPLPLLTVTPESLNFDSVPISFSKDLDFTIINDGEETLTVSDVIPGNPSFTLPDLTVPITLTPGNEYTTRLRFTPQMVGVIISKLTIQSDSSVSPSYDYTVSGGGRAAVFPVPDVKVNGSDGAITIPNGSSINIQGNLSAGDYLGQNADFWMRLTLPDSTTYWLVQSQGLVLSTTPLPLACLPVTDIIAPISFSLPNGPSGNYEVYFVVDDGGCDGTLAGTWSDIANFTVAQTPPDLKSFPASLDFGEVSIGFDKAFATHIVNAGESDLIIDSIAFNSTDFALAGPLSFPLTIIQGASVNISVTFTPSSTGSHTADMIINCNDPVDPAFTIPLSGSGRVAILPVPDVKVNGSDGAITIPNGSSINIQGYLSAGDYLGQNADFWMRLTLPDSTTYWLVQSQGLVLSTTPLPLACLPVTDIIAPISFTLPNNVPSGNYEVYFALDDGGCDGTLAGTWSDTVIFAVTP